METSVRGSITPFMLTSSQPGFSVQITWPPAV
jgi:hypothetical protein